MLQRIRNKLERNFKPINLHLSVLSLRTEVIVEHIHLAILPPTAQTLLLHSTRTGLVQQKDFSSTGKPKVWSVALMF